MHINVFHKLKHKIWLASSTIKNFKVYYCTSNKILESGKKRILPMLLSVINWCDALVDSFWIILFVLSGGFNNC